MHSLLKLAATLLALSAASLAAAQTTAPAWVDRYDGSAQGSDGTDRGFAIAIDGEGNTIVGGFSAETAGSSYLAIKYSAQGARVWVATSTTASGGLGQAMTVDDEDNVVVVGSADSGADFGIVKYDTTGLDLWSQTYDPGPGFLTTFEGVAADTAGSIYAYGNHWPSSSSPWSLIVVKYDADGTFLWDLVYPASRGMGIAVTDDAVYLAGTSEVASDDYDLLVLKISALGTVDWARTFGRTGTFANDAAWDIALDPLANVVAAGSYSGNGDPTVTTDFAVVRLAPDGTLVSEAVYDGPLGLYDEGLELAVDAAGDAIVAGRTEGPGGGYDVLTVKFDAAGNMIWERAYAGLASFTDTPRDLVIDDVGGIYVAGDVISPGLITEYFTIKYDAAGALRWEQLYGGTTYDPSHGMALAVGADRSVSVTGYSAGLGPSGASDAATASYTQLVSIFSDGLESGDASAWSASVP